MINTFNKTYFVNVENLLSVSNMFLLHLLFCLLVQITLNHLVEMSDMLPCSAFHILHSYGDYMSNEVQYKRSKVAEDIWSVK